MRHLSMINILAMLMSHSNFGTRIDLEHYRYALLCLIMLLGYEKVDGLNTIVNVSSL